MLYRVNPEKSQVNWYGAKAGEHNKGMLRLKGGTLVEEFDELVEGKLNIDMHSLEAMDEQLDESANRELVEKIKSRDFLSVEKFPEASFITKEIYTGKNKMDLKGILKFKGYAFGLALPVRVNKKGKELMLEGNMEFKDINPAIREFISGKQDQSPEIEIDYKIVADAVDS